MYYKDVENTVLTFTPTPKQKNGTKDYKRLTLIKAALFSKKLSEIELFAGPWLAKPKDLSGVCLLEDTIPIPASSKDAVIFRMPIQDFSTPTIDEMREVIYFILEMSKKEPVYVGCWGGKGRTGLVLACLAKALHYKEPIVFVRKNYHRFAIETVEQEYFVERFNMPWRYRLGI